MYLRFQEWLEQLISWMISSILGFQSAYKGGLSMGLGDIKIPAEKDKLVSTSKRRS